MLCLKAEHRESRGVYVCACANKICSSLSVPFRYFQRASVGFQLAIDTFSSNFLERDEDYDKFTTISNSVDTRGICWLFGWGYVKDQSANKTQKKAENLKFEIWFTDDQDVHMRLKLFKVSLKMLMFYFSESRSFMWKRSWDIRYENRR